MASIKVEKPIASRHVFYPQIPHQYEVFLAIKRCSLLYVVGIEHLRIPQKGEITIACSCYAVAKIQNTYSR